MGQKIKNIYVCSECGFESAKWNGICPGCSQGNTMYEESRQILSTKNRNSYPNTLKTSNDGILISQINIQDEIRYFTGIKELDRVFGGGIVKGSLSLFGGTPGIGKSTLLLQICNYLDKNLKILYVSGEESQKQIKIRATRMKIQNENLFVMAETDVDSIHGEIQILKPNIVVIDSIQTMNNPASSTFPGSISQVKECSNLFLKIAKSMEISILMVGHVNKDGAIAGPKVLEHMVDVVLYFEGSNQNTYRILRATKNRFGSTNEIGVFQMENDGLSEINNPSEMLLSGRPKGVSGTVVACTIEGTRPILTEVQGLVTVTNFGNPRRMATGFDYNKLSMILAVLEKRAGYFFSSTDTYVNVVGGLKLDEPAADLPISISLVSSLKDKPVNDGIVVFGEVGLSGEIRAVPNAQLRLQEAQRLGFKHCIMPYFNFQNILLKNFEIKITGVKNIKQAIDAAID